MDHIARVEIFIEVAKHQSFAAAARELGITGPAVSKQVQALEDQLDVKLLYRTTRKVTLTEEGALYFDRARKAIEDLREAEQLLNERKECPTGKLKINAPMSFGRQYLVEPIAAFAKRYPEVEVEVDFDDRWVDIVGEGFDVVVRIGALEDSTLIARKLADCPIYLCASQACIEQHGLPEQLSDLADYPAIIYSRHGHQEDWHYIDQNGNKGSVKLRGVFAANNAEMQLEACLKGVGMAVIPVFSACPELQTGKLVRLMPEYQTHPQRGIFAVFPQNRHLSARVRLFVDALVDALKDVDWRG